MLSNSFSYDDIIPFEQSAKHVCVHTVVTLCNSIVCVCVCAYNFYNFCIEIKRTKIICTKIKPMICVRQRYQKCVCSLYFLLRKSGFCHSLARSSSLSSVVSTLALPINFALCFAIQCVLCRITLLV